MKSIASSRKHWSLRFVIIGVLVAIILAGSLVTFLAVSNRNAGAISFGDTGAGSPPTGSGGASAPYTWHGSGWKRFDRASGGPTGGFKSGNWGSIQNTCRDYSHVWVHLILGANGNEVGYSWDPTGDPVRAEWGGDPYAYYGNGTKRPGSPSSWPAAFTNEARDSVRPVYNEYIAEGGPNSSWMNAQIGWFCSGATPPWNVSTTTSAPATAEVGDTITWTHYVQNDGTGTTTANVGWYAESTGSDWPNGTVANWTLGSGTVRYGSSTQYSTYVVQASDFGKQLCRRTVAQPAGRDNPNPTASSSSCVAIIKKPKIQVWGGDLNVGRNTFGNSSVSSNVNGSISRGTDGRYYGSWVEYGITASGSVSGMSSGAGVANGSSTNVMSGLSALTFANTGACIGCYTHGTGVPDVPSRFVAGPSTPVLPLNASNAVNLTGSSPNISGLYRYDGAGTITINANTRVPAGKQIVINARNASVVINQNIEYTPGTLTSISAIPQVVIIARNITIAESVSRVDSWLIATGTGNAGYVNTCGRVTPGAPTSATLNGGTCATALTVNGPVITNKLYLYRTAGALGNAEDVGSPAEVFNLRADAYIWASSYTPGTGRLPTVTTTEVPPRF